MNKTKALSLLIAFCLFATMLVAGCQKTNSEVISDSIVNRFEPYRTMSDDVVSRLSKTAEDEGLPELGISGNDFAYAILDGFDYSIGDIDIDEKKATAEVTIKSKSMTDLLDELNSAKSKFELLGSQATSQDFKTDQVREIIIQSIQDVPVSEETITIDFSLDGTEWKSTNITEALGKLDSALFAG